MDPYVIALTVVALLVALLVLARLACELLPGAGPQTPAQRPDFDHLGPDAGLWPGLFVSTA